MRRLQIRAEGLDDGQLRSRRSDDRARRIRRWTVGSVLVVTAVYLQQYPGSFDIVPSVSGETTILRFIDVSGRVDNPAIQTVALHVNGSYQNASVVGRQFTSRVPLVRGENIIQALIVGTAALLVPGSNVIRITADIPASDIWSELTWDGAGDVDLHLLLPDGEDCYFDHPQTASGAFLDFDNITANGPEHIVMDKAVPGTYRMAVMYYAAHGREGPVQWHVKLHLRDGAITQEFSGVLNAEREVREFWTTDWKDE